VTGRGDLIAGRYGLLARVGHGDMGVWQARDELLDRIVAVRQLPDDLGVGTGPRKSRVAAQPSHPNAVKVHDAVEQSGRYYLVMEHFPARGLSETVKATAPVSEEAIAWIGAQVSGALAAAHDKGITHGDITPANILVGSDGTAKITGFGISRAHGDSDAERSSDVFALGATLHAALESGRSRYRKPITMLRRRRRRPLVDVLLWMRSRDPAERPTMQAAHDALTAVVEGRPTRAPQPVTVQEASGPARRPRRLIRAAVVTVVLLAAGVLVGALTMDRGGAVVTADPGSPEPPVTYPNVTEPPPAPVDPSVPAPTSESVTTSIVTRPTTDVPATPQPPAPTCVARYHVTTVWSGGYLAEVTVMNKAHAITGWTVRWSLPAGHTITNLWDGRLSQRGSAVAVTNIDYNGRLPADGTTKFGLTVNAPGGLNALIGTIPALSCESRPAP
jgi:hypothetical protein